jgi:hypothetical protein
LEQVSGLDISRGQEVQHGGVPVVEGGK